jgi:alkanesulfonate monooxygenase SsuD/methylene tetrahydromethanopterin reductase-like flavin-dependent oxidoreductase (luciferase family)
LTRGQIVSILSIMEFGVQFFPDVKPEQKSGQQYFADCLEIAELADRLGYTHVRIVEHYFHYYGGYSPNPVVFLAAASQRTKRARLVTGAILPVFNHPLKIAGEIGMLDGLSGGRLDVGFARAFLPHEFRRFGISPNESYARYEEGVRQVVRLLSEEHVTEHGQFHSFDDVTSYPRPMQKPHPKIYVAAITTAKTFEYAGKMGYSVMAIPMVGPKMREMLGVYRDAWKAAGHPGHGEVMLAFHMFCHKDSETARNIAREPINAYYQSLAAAGKDWTDFSSADYPGYDKMIESIGKETMENQIAKAAAWVGSPTEIIAMIKRLQEEYRGFEHASMQINFNVLDQGEAKKSLELFAKEVMPAFAPAIA